MSSDSASWALPILFLQLFGDTTLHGVGDLVPHDTGQVIFRIQVLDETGVDVDEAPGGAEGIQGFVVKRLETVLNELIEALRRLA